MGNDDVAAGPIDDTAPTARRASNDLPVSRPNRVILRANVPTRGNAAA